MTNAEGADAPAQKNGSIKRFETKGQISLISLTRLCVALGCADEIRNLFTDVEYGSIEEVLRERT